LEGVEGSGKTLHVELLGEYLESLGFPVVLVNEPSPFLREVIKEQTGRGSSAEVVALLFAADRLKQFEEVVKPALKEGKIVLTDRSVFSSFAYQCAQGLNLRWLEKINENVVLPDLAIVLDINPRVGLQRIVGRNEASNFDKSVNHMALQKKIRFCYHFLARRYSNRITTVHVHNKNVEGTQTLIRKIVLEALEKEAVLPAKKMVKIAPFS